MKSKQEVIQEAWEQWGIPYSEKYVDANGFIAMKQDLPEIVYGALLDIRYSAEGHKDFDYKGGLYRPKSLRGIENNRGWTRIESEEDLPKDDIDCFYIPKRSGKIVVGCFRLSSYKGWKNMFTVDHNIAVGLGQVTHYKPIIKPEAPIY